MSAEQRALALEGLHRQPEVFELVSAMLRMSDSSPRKEDHETCVTAALDGDARDHAMHGARTPEIVGQPKFIGKYCVVKEVGSGGMGRVYLAAPTDDSQPSEVAIKVLQRSRCSPAMLQRFDIETRVLGALNHSNIARLYGTGTLEDGSPYFVQEYVQGVPIDRHCDNNMLSTKLRIELFQRVCSAVMHAHSKSVVHCDIKPSNIIVTPQGEPKLLDFGVAKLLNQDIVGPALAQGMAVHGMTLQYASPEQLAGEGLDTRADVYSLGVLLYQLLTGHLPFSFDTAVREKIVSIVRESDPEAPSDAVTKTITITADGSTRTLTAEQIAKVRDALPRDLSRKLRGDLDCIVLKAMHKSPGKRYDSASALAADLSNYIGCKPVNAHPATPLYDARKFVRRHRLPVTLAALLVFSFGAGAVLTVSQASKARKQTQRLAQMRTFAGEFLEDLRGNLARAEGSIQAREALSKTAVRSMEYLAEEFPQDPQINLLLAQALRSQADVLGGRGSSIGQRGEASERYQQALELAKGIDSARVNPAELLLLRVGCKIEIATLQKRTKSLDAAAKTVREAQQLIDESPEAIRTQDSVQREVSQLLMLQSDIARDDGKRDAAVALAQQSREIRQRLVEKARSSNNTNASRSHRRDLGLAMVKLAKLQTDDERRRAALQEVLAFRRTLAEGEAADETSKRDVAESCRALAAELINVDEESSNARRLLDEALRITLDLAKTSPDAPRFRDDEADTRKLLAYLHFYQRRNSDSNAELDKAEPLCRRARLEQPTVADHAQQLASILKLRGFILKEQGDTEGANALRIEALGELAQFGMTDPDLEANFVIPDN